MRILVDDREVALWNSGQHSGNTFSFTAPGRVLAQISDGPHRLQGIAEYSSGKKLATEIPIIVDSAFNDTRPVPDSRGAITFAGRGLLGSQIKLSRDGRRGDLVLHLEKVQDLRPGDSIMIDGPATERWKKLTQNACLWGTYRRYETVVEKVEGSTVTLSQPLRIEFPVVDGSYIQKIEPIQGCGVENLYLEQTENLWITGVLFSHAWNCWARGVTVRKCGRFPVYGSQAKWCEIRDCLFDDAWFKGGGGTAYTGWDGCWDCLMENVETRKMRHAPLFQWAASGNVIRKSLFRESDGQWHAGWCNENLFEQCRIESVADHGAYGFGLWASPPNDTAHGPNGPRNVVYNCDVSSPKAGLWMGGMNENWLILHNRFVVERGQGVYAGTTSFDHIIQNNVFVLKDGQSPMVFLSRSNCIGVELRDNRLYGGNGKIASGASQPLVNEGNKIFPVGRRASSCSRRSFHLRMAAEPKENSTPLTHSGVLNSHIVLLGRGNPQYRKGIPRHRARQFASVDFHRLGLGRNFRRLIQGVFVQRACRCQYNRLRLSEDSGRALEVDFRLAGCGGAVHQLHNDVTVSFVLCRTGKQAFSSAVASESHRG